MFANFSSIFFAKRMLSSMFKIYLYIKRKYLENEENFTAFLPLFLCIYYTENKAFILWFNWWDEEVYQAQMQEQFSSTKGLQFLLFLDNNYLQFSLVYLAFLSGWKLCAIIVHLIQILKTLSSSFLKWSLKQYEFYKQRLKLCLAGDL